MITIPDTTRIDTIPAVAVDFDRANQ